MSGGSYTPPHNFELDGFFRAVGKLRASNLPGYQELDMGVATLVCAIAVPVHAQSSLEYNVKAALLLNFARFIEWHQRPNAEARQPRPSRYAGEVTGPDSRFSSRG